MNIEEPIEEPKEEVEEEEVEEPLKVSEPESVVIPPPEKIKSSNIEDDKKEIIKKDGSVGFTTDQSMGNNKLTDLAAPVSDNDAARKVDLTEDHGVIVFSPILDGDVARLSVGDTWAEIRDGAGTNNNHDQITNWIELNSYSDEDTWQKLYRAIILFDTSLIPDEATITGAIFSFYCESKARDFVGDVAFHALGLVPTTPGANNVLANSDYGEVGDTQLAEYYPYNSIITTGYNHITLNAAGLAAISKTGLTKLGLRFACDRANVGAWENNKEVVVKYYTSDYTITGKAPKLTVYFTY